MKFGTAYFGNIILKHFQQDLREMKAKGCSFVVLTFSETDVMFHTDAVRKMVVEAKRRGLTTLVDPWAIAGLFGGETSTQLPIWHDGERQVRSDGKRAPVLCLNAPSVTQYLKKWIDIVATFKTDYILWDEPHFYLNWMDKYGGWPKSKAWSCRCGYCQAKFKKQTGKNLPLKFSDEVKDFQSRSIRDFLLVLTRYAARKGQKNAMGFLPDEKSWFLKTMAAEKSVHVLGSEVYFEYDHRRPKDIYQFALKRAQDLTQLSRQNKKPLLMWVKGFRVPKGFEMDVVNAINGLADGKTDWIAMWGFEGCKHISEIACANPDQVWDLMGRTFHKRKWG